MALQILDWRMILTAADWQDYCKELADSFPGLGSPEQEPEGYPVMSIVAGDETVGGWEQRFIKLSLLRFLMENV